MAQETEHATEFLKSLPLFAEIDDDELLKTVAKHFKRSKHAKGDVLAKEGEPQPAMFLIESGKVKRVKGGIPVDELGQDDVSGMLHLFTQDPCFATLVCEEDTVVWTLGAKEFHDLLGVSDSTLAAKLLVVFSKQLRENSKLIRKKQAHTKFTITFFDFKPYEKGPFEQANKDGSEGKYEFNFCPERLSERTVREAAGSDAVCIFVNDRADAKVVEELADMKVKLIALRCAGYNNVDLKACQVHGIQVVRVPAYSPYAVAEHAMGLILTLNRKLHKAYNRTREGNFALQGLLGFDIHGKTVGIVGTGKIGVCLIDILIGFGCTVLCYDVYQNEAVKQKKNTKYVELDELLAQSDIISLHLPLLESTRHMINDKSIAKMKRGVMLINTSRGGLIETSALINGLKTGQIGYAGLDVYEEEEAYFFEDHSAEIISDSVLARLFTFPNVVVTGHQAFFTIDALDNIAQTTVKNVDAFVEGKTGEKHPNNVKADSSEELQAEEEVSVEALLGKRVVFVYDDEGVGPRSLEHTLHSLRQHLDLDRHEVRRIDSNRIKLQKEDEDEATLSWTSEACLLVMPGGADRPYDQALRGAGNARIRAWVEAGGRYLGLCAGGYYGCARVEFEKGAAAGLEVCETRELAFYAGTARGPLVPPGQFDYATERGSRAARLDATQLDPALAAVPVYYNGGCCFVGGGGADPACVALAHYNGLSLDDDDEEDDGGGDGADVARPVAIVSCAVGRGKAVLCGVHPEHDARLLRAAHADDPHLARLFPALERGEPQRQRLFRSLLAHLGLQLAPPPGPDHC